MVQNVVFQPFPLVIVVFKFCMDFSRPFLSLLHNTIPKIIAPWKRRGHWFWFVQNLFSEASTSNWDSVSTIPSFLILSNIFFFMGQEVVCLVFRCAGSHFYGVIL